MESKLNIDALKEYSRAYSERILEKFFTGKDEANGEDILSLSDVKQVNLFVAYQLLKNWKKDVGRLESPYFDFHHKEVKKALKEFANVLSRHILVNKENLFPLVEKAVYETLLLILSPYDFYCNHISNWEEPRIKNKDLKAFSKYVKINHDLLTSFISETEKDHEKEVIKEDALKILNEVFKETDQSPEDIDPYITTFSSKLEVDLKNIYGEYENGEGDKITTETEVSADQDTKPTLNDKLPNPEEKTILADLRKSKKIESIKTHLTINQKFMFVNQLFDGNVDDFNQVIDFLDNCPDQAEAMDFINSNYLKKNNWNKDSNEVIEFIEVIAKKYG